MLISTKMDASEIARLFIRSLIGVFIGSFILLCLYFRKTYNYWKDRGIIYDKPIPILGNLGFIMRRSVWDYCYELRKRYPNDYLGIFLAWNPVLVVQSPELAKNILIKDFDYFPNRFLYSGYSDPLGSLNLFTVRNPLWKQLRYELSPMFTSLRLKKITELMNINATELVKKIKRDYIEKNNVANLKELFSMYTSDTVAYNVFGIRVSILSDQPSPLWYITSHMVKWTFRRGLEFTMIFFVPLVAALLRFKFFSAEATDYVKNIFWNVAKNRKEVETKNENDFVNLLLRLKNKLNDSAEPGSPSAEDVILAQAAVFILGSIETSSTTIAFFLHEIAHHPEVQEKLFNEISEAVKRKGHDILDYNDLLELKYFAACINETLRMHPPVAYLERLCAKDYKLDDSYTIETGTPVFINVLAIHYNEKYYPESEKFRPERFMSDIDTSNAVFLPFGEGPRFCIGKRYGLMQVKASLAQVLLHYKIESVLPYKVKTDPYAVIMAPMDGLSVKFVPR
ncbi:cytochrome P450 6k1-like [Vanessa cardui]|uniref:cytochrome P450 6k1-like n=1 Tax=Vanessa cardui TaxID=171605 RepID=UPI001F14215B|nr:cytochrome P450 6k1-like [Vanessa cardui]